MKVKLITVGKTTSSFLREGEQEYEQRLKHYLKFERIDLKEIKKSKNTTVELLKKKEAELIISTINDSDFLVLLDEKGREFSSIEFSEWMNKKVNLDHLSLVFLIGGAYGFDEKIYSRSQEKISFSRMTFSHQMIRLFFLEQLYRANTILKGEKYHHT